MLDTQPHPAAGHAAAAAEALGAALSGRDTQPSPLLPAVRRLEAQLSMLLTTFHDDAGFWPAFAALIQELDQGLSQSERRRLRSHADFLLVRAGMPASALIGSQGSVPTPVRQP
ncbi:MULTISPECIES: hypothetical protein [unclassified Xanthomonas]|uniref:hypothetical protein n=1 Tax=unclassified Xanthomonas TaxID=2643310 RepID=UPI000B340269|nr:MULTISPECIES: hypothetical protein [unclassified Xanthomonas]